MPSLFLCVFIQGDLHVYVGEKSKRSLHKEHAFLKGGEKNGVVWEKLAFMEEKRELKVMSKVQSMSFVI